MGYLNFKSLYDKQPINLISNDQTGVYQGFEAIINELKTIKKGVVCFETYPGIHVDVLKKELLEKLQPDHLIDIESLAKSEYEINQMLKNHLTDDRVFGTYSYQTITSFYEQNDIELLNNNIDKESLTIICGFGASQIKHDVLVFVSLTRWEIQLRYRTGLTNFKANNPDEDILKKYKRGYFVEWRVADRIKEDKMKDMDYIIDLNDDFNPKMITHERYEDMLDEMVNRPFRMVPYFDPGVWGGQWMKEVCHLDKHEQNFAWSFDGVPEENSIKVQFGDVVLEFPAQDVVQFRTIDLMGKRVFSRFGKHFPIRFDLLDTFEGGNLSLQVHPLTSYIQDKFGMTYTQDESYYILDAKKDASVYLGFKTGVDEKAFKEDLVIASRGDVSFDAEKYINKIPVKKHDHFLIPAGTIHCSGKDTMVLEISACVYIFTFKLWDWDRLGLDGRPRPVHLEHGFKNLQFDRQTEFVEKELVNHIERIDDKTEKTGLHELEFLDTFRFSFDDEVSFDLLGSVNVGNLVEGSIAEIHSVNQSFEPFEIHYAETFVLPEKLGKVRVKCLDKHGCKIIKANVR